MGIYREDHVINISRLVELWVVEGFLKPVSGKRPEDVARACIKDLTDRNLILIHKLGSNGSIKECKVHDLLRDLCSREVQKEGFYTICPGHEIEDWSSRIVMRGTIQEIEEIEALSSAPLARTLVLNLDVDQSSPLHILSQLRIIGSEIVSDDFIGNLHQLVNSRLFTLTVRDTELPSSIRLFWNLQTLIVSHLNHRVINVPTDIWHMSHIRHLHIKYLSLPHPPDVKDGIVLVNLQTLGKVRDFTCSEQMVKTIPNITKLHITYNQGVDDMFCLTNLDCLDKLESLKCYFNESMCLINFTRSLKKLTLLVHSSQCWVDILDKIGALPLLEKLKLYDGTFKGKWETSDGQFRSLKFLYLGFCEDLQVWTSEASQFPRLEHLYLMHLFDLEEIPSDFAELSTLRLIDMQCCSDSAVVSANRILEEQEALYGEEETSLQIHVHF